MTEETKKDKKVLEDYRAFVHSLSVANKNQGDERIFVNGDKEMALIVLVELFKFAKKEICIFAANLCSDVGTETEYVESLSDFIENSNEDGKVKILLNNLVISMIPESKLFKRLAYYKSKGKNIIIKQTNMKVLSKDEGHHERHFTIIDSKAFRIETDIINRTARCSFNNPNVAKKYSELFNSIFEDGLTTELNFVKFFNYGN